MGKHASPGPKRVLGRYALYGEIASGGMATVHFGRMSAPAGFARTVAIKRMLPQFVSDPGFVSMFVDEARLASRIRHPNVIPTLDVVSQENELFLVLDYVHGETLSQLIKALHADQKRIPPAYAAAIVCGMLHGLHAAHNVKNARGELLGLVHHDVSPQNVLVGTDGMARLLDFGVAKAAGRLQVTINGQVKGKLAYMAPEQVRGTVTPQSDVYAAAAVLW
jgi:serine/threonine-protein kinase